ncbi:hypothetical protein SEA_BRUHMOMENT_22 [Arthrobacter phage BruhMoment]|nr:hypothetical protein SEA_BRUHMOMENT_22 [Arthrobacter phage BruhMoment]
MVAIEAPVLAPAVRRTLLDVANVQTDLPPYALMQGGLRPLKYEPVLHIGVLTDIPTDNSDKSFQKLRGQTKTPQLFGAYMGLDDPLLNGLGAGAPELEALFTAGEALYVEDKVQKLVLSPAAVDLTPTPGTPLKDVKAAIGLLEQWHASRYLYRPTLSGNLLALNLIQSGTPATTETVNGTPIAAAAGYGTDGPGNAVSTASSAWLYISGQINVWKGEAAQATGPDLHRNRDLTLIEKRYAASVEGPVAAVLIGF